MTVRQALLQGAELLERSYTPAARLTAEVLLCHALGKERSFLYGHPEEELSEVAWIHYGRYLYERLEGKPTQYITRRQEFYGREFRVSPAVLIPRPETEHVIETALRLSPRPTAFVDVGCGSGAIAITFHLERPAARAFACDISGPALEVAADNARRLGAGVHFLRGDLLGPIATRSLELVLSNPPYVPANDKAVLQREVRDYEPEVALYGGPTGVEIYERLIADAARVLRPGGWLVMEIGYRAEQDVRQMLGQWGNIESVADLAGIPRVLAAQWG
ncbi:MAG: peptide chain release factor N(5)-glutamine methyltransferase [Acidobacteria bacterium]|nr:peptide chain release factor N(5)-glutamine methyltransferase [Acidobacteriota bacterium]